MGNGEGREKIETFTWVYVAFTWRGYLTAKAAYKRLSEVYIGLIAFDKLGSCGI